LPDTPIGTIVVYPQVSICKTLVDMAKCVLNVSYLCKQSGICTGWGWVKKQADSW